MSSDTIAEKPALAEGHSTLKALIATANKNDRFHLLEDGTVLACDLDNDIHPIFEPFEHMRPLRQALLLASRMITERSILPFFVPLLYGREYTDMTGDKPKSFLSNPLERASADQIEEYLDGVRDALICLADCINFRFVYIKGIALHKNFSRYYLNPNGYQAASRCAQFRHDFSFATALTHEIVHAVGVQRRGHIEEPYIHHEWPKAEWGWAWEHYLFGGAIDPQSRLKFGTHLFLRKLWSHEDKAKQQGGKEYHDVNMAYVAQWFRKDTWNIIAEKGPTAIPPPKTHFKVQRSQNFSGYIVSSDYLEMKKDLVALQDSRTLGSLSPRERAAGLEHIFWRYQTTPELQRPSISMHPRLPRRTITTVENPEHLHIYATDKPPGLFESPLVPTKDDFVPVTELLERHRRLISAREQTASQDATEPRSRQNSDS
ncbi:hypothetical protein IQ07DRAFT_659803 [Pyrenochaeta sp. DS3sAY3a]|nr:hypothetical protein IQ07DRAFT_659803 [Pyrenochaeta sp. DS3sAY3a]